MALPALADLGYTVTRQTAISDEAPQIQNVVRESCARGFDYVTGGLVRRATIARAELSRTGRRRTARDDEVLRRITDCVPQTAHAESTRSRRCRAVRGIDERAWHRARSGDGNSAGRISSGVHAACHAARPHGNCWMSPRFAPLPKKVSRRASSFAAR
jgi:hypothetical protein